MKILVTGFDPFGGDKVNPAYEAVKLLPDKIAGAEVIKQEVPTIFSKCGATLKKAIKKYQPDAVICVGQAGGRADISVERLAINLIEARIPDNEGKQPLGAKIEKKGETAYFTSLPAKAMVQNIKEHGIPAHVSYTAGTYVCNAIMYHLLYQIATEFPKIRGGFIHVPFDTPQVLDRPVDTPSMPVETISKALEYAVEAVVKNEKDIDTVSGEIA